MYDFFFPQRLRRLSYFFRAVLLGTLVWVATERFEQFTAFSLAEILFGVGTLLLIIYGVFFVYLPRLRDCGVPGWTLIFAWIPVVSYFFGILLLFKRSRLIYGTTAAEDTRPEVITVAGSHCAACGNRLIFSTDRVVTAEGKVLCHRCLAKEQAPASSP